MPKNKKLTLEEKIDLLTYGLIGYKKDGAYSRGDFPDPIGIAASFDTDVMFSYGKYAAEKARQSDEPFALSPSADLNGDPRCKAVDDTLGEDPLLSGSMTAAFAEAVFGSGETACAIPVISGFYTVNESGENASVPAALKRDYYLKPFEMAMKSGFPKGIYAPRGKVNGIETRRSPELSAIAKNEWGALFTAADGRGLADNSDYSDSLAEILANNAADIICDDPEILKAALREALDAEKIKESNIDRAISGLITAKNLLDKKPETNSDNSAAIRAAEKSVVLLRNQNLVLPFSRKEPICVVGYYADLNFGGSSSTILDSIVALAGRENVIYEPGNDVIALRNAQTGFYFAVNDDGMPICSAPLINERCLFDLYDWGSGKFSLKSKFNGKFVLDSETLVCGQSEPGIFTLIKSDNDYRIKHSRDGYMHITADGRISANGRLKPPKNSLFHIEIFSSGADRVSRAVSETHNVVVFCGNHPKLEEKGAMRIPDKQRKIADGILGLNSRAALFLVTGNPCVISPKFDTVIQIPHGGSAMGAAAAGALFGAFSPAGRCPVTWYASESDLSDEGDRNIIRAESTYRYFSGKPLFPFGYGLSYTSFRYGAIKLNKSEFSAGERIEVTFEVSNIGKFASDEVVQLYSTSPRFSRGVPQKELRAFKRIHIPAGEQAIVTLSFNADDLALWDINENKFKLYGGDYQLQAGCSSADIMRTRDFKISGEKYRGINVTKPVSAAVSYDYINTELRTDSRFEEYALINGGSLIFENCFLNGENKLEIVAANPASAVTVSVVRTDIQAVVATVEIPHTGGTERFVTVTADLCRIDGICDLKFSADGTLAFKSFRMLNSR